VAVSGDFPAGAGGLPLLSCRCWVSAAALAVVGCHCWAGAVRPFGWCRSAFRVVQVGGLGFAGRFGRGAVRCCALLGAAGCCRWACSGGAGRSRCRSGLALCGGWAPVGTLGIAWSPRSGVGARWAALAAWAVRAAVRNGRSGRSGSAGSPGRASRAGLVWRGGGARRRPPKSPEH